MIGWWLHFRGEHAAWLPHWLHWLAYMPTAVLAVVLCLIWPVSALIGKLWPGPRHLGEWPDDGQADDDDDDGQAAAL